MRWTDVFWYSIACTVVPCGSYDAYDTYDDYADDYYDDDDAYDDYIDEYYDDDDYDGYASG